MARIPTRFDLSMTPAGRFMQLLDPQTPRPQSRMTARDALGRISVAGPRLPSAGPQPSPLPPFGLRKGVMDRLAGTQQTMGTVPSLPPKKPMSLMERLSPELGTPASAGLGAAAATGLQMSGYSPTPISTAQGLGAMMQSGMKAFQAAKAAETSERRAALQDRIAMAKLGKKSDFEERLALAGIDASTPEGQSFIREMLTKSDTQINLGEGKKQEMFLKSALEDRTKIRADTQVDPKVEVRLDQAIAMLEDGVATGGLEGTILPFKKILSGMGLLGDEELEELSAQEALNAFASQLVPMQRVAGSGASSDADMNLYKDTVFGLDKTPYANLIIAKTMKQINRHNKLRLSLLDDYIKENGTTLGFGDYADAKLPRIFHRVGNVDELQKLYDAGDILDGDTYYSNEFNKFMFVEFE